MFRSFDPQIEYFKILITIVAPDPTNSDDLSDIQDQANWEEHFGSSLRVYEKKHLFPSLLINYEDGSDDANRDPDWLSQIFEYGFIRLIKLTSHNQTSQLPKIIRTAVKKINTLCFYQMLEHLTKMGKRQLDEFPALNISFSLMDTPTKDNGMKEILTYPLGIFMLLQNAREIISIIKFLMSFKIYGKIIISQEAWIEFLFLVLNLILLPASTDN